MTKLLFSLWLAFFSVSLYANEFIVHAVSVHQYSYYYDDDNVKKPYNNANYGIGVKFDDGWTVGIYNNSYNRISAYAGYTWIYNTSFNLANRPMSLNASLLAVTGYEKQSKMLITPSVVFSLSIPITEKTSLLANIIPTIYNRDDHRLGLVGNLSFSYRY